MANNTSNRGLGSDKMDEQTKREIQSKGGQASARKQDMSELGRKGGEASRGGNSSGGRGRSDNNDGGR